MMNTVGILLAGGLSRRYGSPKAFAKVENQYFFEHAYELLSEVSEHVIIITREEFVDWFPSNYHVIVDVEAYKGCGPFAGIYSGMLETEATNYVVLPCDMPLLKKDVLPHLLEAHQQTVTIVDIVGRLQPLVSVWNRKMMPSIKEALENRQFKITDVFKERHIVKVDSEKLTTDLQTFMNINTSEEDKEMRKWLK